MKVGDLVIDRTAVRSGCHGVGVIVKIKYGYDVLIQWSNGKLAWRESDYLEVVNEK
jgi:hypothetical protein